MARLQDFQTVTPTSSDKLLVVQSQGQGLVPYGSKLDSANPTGTGSLSMNRKANTTVGAQSTTEGLNCEASGSRSHSEGMDSKSTNAYAHSEGYSTTSSGNSAHSEGYQTTASNTGAHSEGRGTTASGNNGAHAEGYNTNASGDSSHAEGNGTVGSGIAAHSEGSASTASGNYAHAEGLGTIANRVAQHTFGSYNVADTTGADETVRGSYIEIVGKGVNANNRSNARTLDWSGNEVLAGDLTYNGNVSLTRLLNQYYFKTGSPIVISGLSRYETFIVMGFAQSIGTVVIMVTISGGTLDSPINMKTGSAFSNSHLTFTYSSSSNSLTIASDNTNESRLTVIRG